MSLDYSAVPHMPDGRTALETIESVAATSQAVRVPMGNGGRMMWHVWGEGSGKPTLLLFHGGSGSWIHWIRNVLPLSQHFTVYAADMPGLGDSDPPDDVRDIWSVTDCVDHAVNALLPKDRPFYLTGFSFGGMVSGHLSTRMGERIRRIVMVGAGGLKATRKPTEKLHKLLPSMPPQVLADEARRNLELLMLHDPRNVDGVAIYMQIMNTTRARTRSRDMGIAGALSNVLPRVRTPLTGIWGEFDSTTYPYIQQRIDIFRRCNRTFKCTSSRGPATGLPTRRRMPSMRSSWRCSHEDRGHRDRRQDLPPVDPGAADRAQRVHVQPVPDRCRGAAAVPLRPSRHVPADLAGGGERDSAREAALDGVQPCRGRRVGRDQRMAGGGAPGDPDARPGRHQHLGHRHGQPRAARAEERRGRRSRWQEGALAGHAHVPHNWDAGLVYEETTGTLFSSDLFTQMGPCAPTTAGDIVDAAVATEKAIPFMPDTPLTAPTLRRLAGLKPRRSP
jgi:pimeloyl-ACP methyl ester carboxylesterase